MIPVSVLLGSVFLLLSASFILLTLNTDLKRPIVSFKDGVVTGQRAITGFLDGINYFEKISAYTEYLVSRTGLAYYNTWLHLALCIAAGVTAFKTTIRSLNLLPAVSFAMIVSMTPYILLKLAGDFMAEKERKYSVDFLIILKNFLTTSKNHDIFEAFEEVIPYVIQPLKRYLSDMVDQYKHKVNPVTCLNNFKDNISTPELRLYIENLSICYIQGGDIEALTNTFVEELALLDDEEDKENAQDQLLNYGLYVLLGLNFSVIYWTLNGKYKMEILGNFIGQLIFTLDMVASMYIIYMTLKRA